MVAVEPDTEINDLLQANATPFKVGQPEQVVVSFPEEIKQTVSVYDAYGIAASYPSCLRESMEFPDTKRPPTHAQHRTMKRS